jgi:hypothetical protein
MAVGEFACAPGGETDQIWSQDGAVLLFQHLSLMTLEVVVDK